MKILTFGDYLDQIIQNHYFSLVIHGQPKQADGLSLCHRGYISVLSELISQLVISVGYHN